MILCYVPLFHLNSIGCLHSISVCVWFWVFYVCQKYPKIFIIMEGSLPKWKKIKSTMRKTEVLEKCSVIFMKHLRIPQCPMIVISTKKRLTWPSIICVPTHCSKMRCHRKCVFHYCENFAPIYFPSQEWDNNHSKTCPTIHFRVWKMVSWYTVHFRLLPSWWEASMLCFAEP